MVAEIGKLPFWDIGHVLYPSRTYNLSFKTFFPLTSFCQLKQNLSCRHVSFLREKVDLGEYDVLANVAD